MYLVFDIGATKTRLAVSKDFQNLEKVVIFETPQSYEAGISSIKNYFSKLGGELKMVAGCLPGTFDAQKTHVLFSKNMPEWEGKPLKGDLEDFLKCPVYIGNDSSFAALGEAHLGAGIGKRVVAYLTISTGVGGKRVVDGKIDMVGSSYEPGYQIVDANFPAHLDFLQDRDKYPNGAAYLQRLISGDDLQRRFKKDPKLIADPVLWNEVANYLAIGINNVIAMWSPDVVVLGGGIINAKRVDIQKINSLVREYAIFVSEVPEVRFSKLGDKAGLVGGLKYLEQL